MECEQEAGDLTLEEKLSQANYVLAVMAEADKEIQSTTLRDCAWVVGELLKEAETLMMKERKEQREKG